MQVDDSNALIQNINYQSVPDQPKLLLCYMAGGYFSNLETYKGRTQYFEIFEIVKVFSGLGYCIDIIYCNDTKALEEIKNKSFKVIFGFGETFFLISQLQKEATTIYYMTENHPDFSFREENKRLEYFYLRHGHKMPVRRSGSFYKPSHMRVTHSFIITMSETEPLREQYKKPYTIFPTGITNNRYVFRKKNQEKTRKNFLCLGSAGAIHKGLDLLIDVIANREDITLHFGGFREEEKKMLGIPLKSNIIDHGFIDIQSESFLKIADECSFIILLSCSEACSTSITTGMLHGLIPVVMKDAGFNRLDKTAIFFEDYKIEYIDNKITEICNYSAEDLQFRSERAYKFAIQYFTPAAFSHSFEKIISDIFNIEN